MKSLAGAIAATLIGLAMLVGGIVGVAGGFDSDSDSDETATDVSNFTTCRTTDERFDEFDSIEMSGRGGDANVLVSCQAGEVEISMIATSLPAEEDRTVSLWLYNGRDDHAFIASTQQAAGEPTVLLSSNLPEDSSHFKKIVVTEGPASPDFADPAEPGRVIVQARL
jgi:hypothetical protein